MNNNQSRMQSSLFIAFASVFMCLLATDSLGNTLPVADAGPDQDVVPDELVFLDGTNSSDAEGPIQAYSWRFASTPLGSAVTDASIFNRFTSTPSFTPDDDGVYILELTVTDTDSAQDADTVSISVETPKFFYFIHGTDNTISLRNKSTGVKLLNFTITLTGQTVDSGSGLAVNPRTNEMFAALTINGDTTTRELVTLAPLNGTATSIGDLGDVVQGLAFDKFGTLYAVTGEPGSATTPETLYTVDTSTGAMTFEQTLGNGGDGEDIAYNSSNNTIYHASGSGDQIFETINLESDTTTDIPYSGDPTGAFIVDGVVYDETQDLFLGTMLNAVSGNVEFFSLTTAGVVTTITSPVDVTPIRWSGHAFWDPDFQQPTLAVNDFNGDRKSDILWRHSVTGVNWVYLMDGASIDTSQGINTESDQNWQIVGNGDYNGDGKSDIFWRNSVTGRNWMYLMNGASISTSQGVNTESDQNWQIVGNGDYNGDGKSDILWRNMVTGRNWMYLMNGASISTSQGVNTESDQNWQIVNVD